MTLLARRQHMHRVFRELARGVEAQIAASPEPQNFIAKFLSHIGWTRADFETFVTRTQSDFEGSMLESTYNRLSTERIPHLTHRIWITSPENPSLPPAEFLANYLAGVNVLPSDWTHFFWTNSDIVARHVSALASQLNRVVMIGNLQTIDAGALAPRLAALVAARKFVLAADVFKFVILNQMGGIYADLGIGYNNDVIALVEIADYALVIGPGLFFQTSFFACAPNSNVSSIFLAVMSQPEIMSRNYTVNGDEIRAIEEVECLAGPGFTASVLMFMPKSARTVILPPTSEYLVWTAQQSWYGKEAKFGNVLIHETGPTFMRNEAFAEHVAGTKERLKFYGLDRLMREQLTILVGCHQHFADTPTRLCKIFYYNGSDKAHAWHNYGYVYNYLLSGFIGRKAHILEVGIGTNNLDVPSSMGVTGVPGASLKAWKEFFVDAALVGADVDTRILFQEERISTYFVDQTRPDTIAKMYSDIGEQLFDVVIDDGLHTYEANMNMLVGSMPRLKAGGLFIVEDVGVADIGAWDNFLAQGEYRSAIIRLPSDVNQNDNCLVVLLKE